MLPWLDLAQNKTRNPIRLYHQPIVESRLDLLCQLTGEGRSDAILIVEDD